MKKARAKVDSQKCSGSESELIIDESGKPGSAPDRLRITQFCLDNAAEAIFWMEANARFTYVNKTACRSLGYSRQELLSMTVHDIDPNFPKEVWAEHWQQLRRQGSFTIESLHRAKDGRTFPVEINVNYLKYGDKEYNCAFARDITERKHAEELIRVSERRYRTLADNIGIGIAHMDIDHNIVIVNSAVGSMFNMDPSEFVGKKCYKMFERTRGTCSHCPGDEAIRTGRPAEIEAEGVRGDGSRFPVRVQAFPLFSEEGKPTGFIEVAEDLTERKRTEEEIEKFFNMTGYMICIASIDGYFTRINKSFEQTLGYSSQELLSRPYLDFVHPDDREKTKAVVENKLAKGAQVVGFENRYRCKDGSYKWLSWVSHPVVEKGITYAIAYDITDRKLAEQAARETQERFSDFFVNAPIGFHIVGPDQVLIDINEAELAMLGYERDEVVGKKKWTDLIVPEQKKQFEKQWHDITTKGQAKNLEYTLVHKDGYRIDVVLNASSRFDEKGNLINTRGSVLNITARKRAETARNNLIKELEAKHKELEAVLYAASHDLKSPLVNIQGFGHELLQSCDLIRSALAGEKKTENAEKAVDTAINRDIPESLEFILTSTKKMDSLLSGLLDVCRLNTAAVNIGLIDMNKMMADVAASMEYQMANAGATIKIESLPPCLGDPSQINRVFTNLLTNALKFLSPGRAGHIRIHAGSRRNQSIYCVEDNGIGISPEHLDKIFEIFYQLEPAGGQGEGIGLAIVKRIIDRHNGKVWAESTAGKGSKFFVALPGA
ncbi:MAG: PAS domain S-box protein [Phycisphaerales bacterium]|nr:MAG: PAS domain S-box protein [Phycisphaerales bacterium]